MSDEIRTAYEFGPFHLSIAERQLLKNGEQIALYPKAFDTLVALIHKHGHLVTKDELLKEVWQDTFVEESNLCNNISLLRKALGEDPNGNRYIETVPRYGYRFVGDVREIVIPNTESVLRQHTVTRIFVEEEKTDRQGEDAKLIHPNPLLFSPALGTDPSRFRNRNKLYVTAFAFFVGVVALFYWWELDKVSRTEKNDAAQSIAVLPFKLIGADSRNEHLGLGMTDATISKLSSLQQFTVRPTMAVFEYAERQNFDALEAGRALGVDAVLEGTVQRSGDSVRVTVQLIDVRQGRAVWSERFDESFTNIFAVQDTISTQVAWALRSNLTGGERTQFSGLHTENIEAHEAYLRGLYFWNKRTEEGLVRSIEYFEQATRLDPYYALAFAGLADSYALLRYYHYSKMSGDEALQKARIAVLKSLSLDNSIAEAHAAYGLIRTLEGDYAAAEGDFKRAIALRPDSAVAHFRYSSFLLPANRLGEAATHAKRAQELDPVSTVTCSNYASTLFFLRRYPEAVEYSGKALEVDPHHFHGLLILALSYEQMGKHDEAVMLLEKRNELYKDRPDVETLRSLGHAYALSGRNEEARQMLLKLDEWSRQDRESLFSKVLIHAALGEMDKAFLVLEKLAPDWKETPLGLRIDPRYDIIKSDARYTALMRRRFGSTV